jgi:hypothetical protein
VIILLSVCVYLIFSGLINLIAVCVYVCVGTKIPVTRLMRPLSVYERACVSVYEYHNFR